MVSLDNRFRSTIEKRCFLRTLKSLQALKICQRFFGIDVRNGSLDGSAPPRKMLKALAHQSHEVSPFWSVLSKSRTQVGASDQGEL